MMKPKFNLPIQVRWDDLDPLGHVNNAVFISYFQLARGYFMPYISEEWNWKKHMFLIANVHADYLRELTLYDRDVSCEVEVSKVGSKSFELTYTITSGKTEKVIHCKGKTTQVMFDIKTRNTIAIPEWLLPNLKN